MLPHQDACAYQNALSEFQSLFNSGDYFEAHEVLEHQWLLETGEQKVFLQGLIQLAAAMIKWREQNWRGANRLIQTAGEKIQGSNKKASMLLSEPMATKLQQLVMRIQKQISSKETFCPPCLTLF